MFYRDEMIRFWRTSLRRCRELSYVMLQLTTVPVTEHTSSEPLWQEQHTIGGVACLISAQAQGGVVVRCVLPDSLMHSNALWAKRLRWLRCYCRWRGSDAVMRWVYPVDHMPMDRLPLWAQSHAWQRSLYGVLPEDIADAGLSAMNPSTSAETCHRHLSLMAHKRRVHAQWHCSLPVLFGVRSDEDIPHTITTVKGQVALSWQVVFQFSVMILMGLGALGVMSHRFMRQQAWCDQVLAAVEQPQANNETAVIQQLHHRVMLTYPPQTAWMLRSAYYLWRQYVEHAVMQAAPLIVSQPLPAVSSWRASVRQSVALTQPTNLPHMALALLAATDQGTVGRWMNSSAGKQFWQRWGAWAQQAAIVITFTPQAQWQWFVHQTQRPQPDLIMVSSALRKAPRMVQRLLLPVLHRYRINMNHAMATFIQQQWQQIVWHHRCSVKSLRQHFGLQGQVARWRHHYINGLRLPNRYGFVLPERVQKGLQAAAAIQSLLVHKHNVPNLLLTPIRLSKNLQTVQLETDLQQWGYDNGPRHTVTIPWLNTTNSMVSIRFQPFGRAAFAVHYGGPWPMVQWLRHTVMTPLGDNTLRVVFAQNGYALVEQLGVTFGNVAGVWYLSQLRCV